MTTIQMPETGEHVRTEILGAGTGAVSASKMGKEWARTVTAVDPSQRGGYAIQGDFLSVGTTQILPVGTVVLAYADWNAGSHGNQRWVARALLSRVQPDGSMEEIECVETDRGSWAAETVAVLSGWVQEQAPTSSPEGGEIEPEEAALLQERVAALEAQVAEMAAQIAALTGREQEAQR